MLNENGIQHGTCSTLLRDCWNTLNVDYSFTKHKRIILGEIFSWSMADLTVSLLALRRWRRRRAILNFNCFRLATLVSGHS